MKTISLDLSNAQEWICGQDLNDLQNALAEAHSELIHKTGKGHTFLGWIDLPDQVEESLIASIEADAAEWKKKTEVVVVIGIGGSYLGARAVIEALQSPFHRHQAKQDYPQIIYAGHHLDEDYLSELLELLNQKDYGIVVISKSGTTTEPAIAFRMLRDHMEKKYGKSEAQKRIIAITDVSKGALKQLATQEGYRTYVIPDDVGGRFSVLTPVGLLPIAMAGFDIRGLLNGAKEMKAVALSGHTLENPCVLYAAARNVLYQKGKKIEVMASYNPRLSFLAEWWKQLYGESEGKEWKGLFPASVNFTSDLHSLGQYIQDGERILFETVIAVENNQRQLTIPNDPQNLDQLNFITGKRLGYVNLMAQRGTTMAHVDGGVPNLIITIPEINAFTIGQLIYFYEFACGLSGYVLGVNPFDQPGVEAYKKNMFKLLGKPE